MSSINVSSFFVKLALVARTGQTVDVTLMLIVHLSPLAGIKKSDKSAEIYRRSEAKHAMITKAIFRVAGFLGIVLNAISAILPILYACFNFPSPDKWILAIEIQ